MWDWVGGLVPHTELLKETILEKITFFATCQGEVISKMLSASRNLAEKYTLHAALNFSSPGVAADPAQYSDLIRESSFFIYQHNALMTGEFLSDVCKNTTVIRIPYITSSIYWPTLVNPPLEKKLLRSKTSPFGIIPFRCRILDQMIAENRDDEAIVREYCALNMADHVDLDTHYQGQIEYLAKMDAQNPHIKVAPFVDQNIRSKQLFWLFNHPSFAVLYGIIDQLFGLFGVANDLPDDLQDTFAFHQTPIHPSVAKYFGLEFVKPELIWRVGPHKVSFEDYVRLYIQGYRELEEGALIQG